MAYAKPVGGSGSATVTQTGSVGIVFDNHGVEITAGVTGYITVPYACTLEDYSITGDTSGSIVIDVWKVAAGAALPTVANTICGGNKPTITSATNVKEQALTSWTDTAVAAYDIFGFKVDSCTNLALAVLVIKTTKI